MTVFCSFCDNEATMITGSGSGLCATCALAYELGQSEPDEVIAEATDPPYRDLYYSLHPEFAECSACGARGEVRSTYCGSFCENCLREHLQSCTVCREDY